MIEPDLIFLCQNEHGHHFIQALINQFHEGLIKRIFCPVFQNFNILSVNPRGLIVIKKLMGRYKTDTLKTKIIIMNLQKNAAKLVQNKIGNYLIQYALEIYNFDIYKNIIELILENILSFSIQKFSSNVIEKCMEISPKPYKKKFILEITQPGTFIKLLNNKFGNFVIQKALKIAEQPEQFLIITELY